MAVTIKDVLELDIMKGFKVVAGENGLSETINSTEILDFEFLQEGAEYRKEKIFEGESIVLSSLLFAKDQPELVLDAVNSGSESRAVRECAPLTLPAGETANVTVYVDHSVLEVFANDRQAITRRVYMPLEKAVFQLTNVENTRELSISTMMPSQPY